jgi:cardiolipin synthase
MTLRWLPNAVTVLRMLLAAPLLLALGAGRYGWAFWIAVLAGLSDGIDGWLAKRYGWRSEFGGLLDPLADKALLTMSFLGLWWSGQLPGWLVGLVLARDATILAGAAVWWGTLGPFEAAPTKLSKFNTVLQILTVAAVLAHAAIRPLPPAALQALLLACAALTLASGVDYVIRYGMRYRRALRSRT